MSISPITKKEFDCFQRLIYEHAGIYLAPEKKVMVAGRLAKRLHFHGLTSYGEYFRLLSKPEFADEFQIMVNFLTTNETYFFREPKHFEFLRTTLLKSWQGENFNAWSAACSSGEEAYSLAMILAETLGRKRWTILGSDLSTRVLDIARNGIYPMARLEQMDPALLKKYCLRGVRSQEGFFRVDESLIDRTHFEQINLMQSLPNQLTKHFDVIFLRNVLIYFDQNTKKAVVERIIKALKPGGYFFISHSESLHRVTCDLEMIKPSIFRKNDRSTL
ncbi:CheR family methyltransferase [Methylotuvimicrobium sp. KM1]|uniref:CheR family methyltransferase n=1 Tax=Methylotuvimicrobium sp. KM1 TaxID=3377707 RepID=UPI00384AB87B